MKAKFLLSLLLLPFFCFSQSNSEIEIEIRELMKKQENCWNLGDIPCFMEEYWYSDSLQFIGSSGITYGYKNTLNNYLQKYPDKETMGTLNLEILNFDFLNNESVYVVGKWNLKRKSNNDIGGYFTLLWKKKNNKWVIVSDHSS